MSDQIQKPCAVITSFFPSLSKAILVTAELPVLCNVFFSYLLTILFKSFRHAVFIFEVFIPVILG